jgi:hypothetical protein
MRIGLVDDYRQKIELSLAHLYRLAEVVLSAEFPLIIGLRMPTAGLLGINVGRVGL